MSSCRQSMRLDSLFIFLIHEYSIECNSSLGVGMHEGEESEDCDVGICSRVDEDGTLMAHELM